MVSYFISFVVEKEKVMRITFCDKRYLKAVRGINVDVEQRYMIHVEL